MIQIMITPGEAFDRLSILALKADRLTGDKRELASRQYDELEKLVPRPFPLQYGELFRVNGLLWDVEERLREMESRLQVAHELIPTDVLEPFVELARSVYRHNDERARLKQQIDGKFGMRGEVKSYV